MDDVVNKGAAGRRQEVSNNAKAQNGPPKCSLLARAFGLGAVVALAAMQAHGASVTSTGHSTSFSSLPAASDWATVSPPGGVGAFTSAAALDTGVQAYAASAFLSQLVNDAGNPPAVNALGTWSSSGGYVATRPTVEGATLLLCSLINSIGGEARSFTVSYDFAQAAVVAEDVPGLRVYYSATGAAGTWVNIPELSSGTFGRLTATVNVPWPAASSLYLLFADDNGPISPDTSYQIDNFTVTAVLSTQIPASITASPQSQTVNELASATFTAAVAGNPTPTLQWYTNNVAVAGETGESFSISSAPLSFNGMTIKAVAQNVASNVAYSVTSSVATLTVNADIVAPSITDAASSGLNLVVVSFSERLTAASAQNVANYAITGPGGSLTISNAVLDVSGTNVLITVNTMTAGALYTLTVNNLRDRSAAANQIANNSQVTYTAAATAYAEIGNASVPASVSVAGGGYNVSAAGTNILGSSDQFTFVYQPTAGDFDLKVRVAAFSSADAWARSGLMAREALTPTSPFAAALASPAIAGSVFEYRPSNAAQAVTTGGLPVNYPYTWLRLVRAGSTFTAYAGFDGQSWTRLGSTTIAMPTTIYVGVATSSGSSNQRATTQFRELQSGAGGTIASSALAREPLDTSSRKTGIVISEIMYNPKGRPDGKIVEFIELYNSRSIFEDISGWRISGEVSYTFPPGTVMQPGSFVVLARVASDVQSVYGITGVFQYGSTNYSTNSVSGIITTNISPSLNNAGGIVRLRNKAGAVLLDITYDTRPPWPLAADGTGHSMVLARPSYGENDPRAWDPSDVVGGSPGTFDSVGPEPGRNIMINEIFARSTPPATDFIELYNHGNVAVDLSGFWLSDRPDVNRFRIPNGTMIQARSFVSFPDTQLGFALSSDGEQIYLVNSNQNRVIHAIDFDAQLDGVSLGRYPDGAPALRQLVSRTPGAANSAPIRHTIVISEIMYNPISGNGGDEFIELYNRGTGTVSLAGWRFTDGVTFTFPAGASIAAGGYVVVGSDSVNLRSKYSQLTSANTFGNYSGSLANSGEKVTLSMPTPVLSTNGSGQVSTGTVYVAVNAVHYGTDGVWGDWSDGRGSSLELIDLESDNTLPSNWADSDDTGKSSWTSFEYTAPVDNQQTGQGNGDQLQLFMLGVGECIIDDVEVRTTGANLISNGSFESDLGTWTRQGSHDQSFIDPAGFTGKGLHILAMSRGDNGGNRIRCPVSPAVAGGTATLRAKARWLRGFPEVLLRLRGGGIEAFGRLPVPANLGTPGLANSRAIGNAGPAVTDVTHSPVLPQVGESARVTARVDDPDGISRFVVRYRVDPGTTYSSVNLVDTGLAGDEIAGDGLFSATIPAQNSGAMVAFFIEAVDGDGVTNIFPANATSRVFPNDAPGHEALIRWGETQMPGSFATYHIWVTSGVNSRWTARDRLNNSPLDGTFVYNNSRVVYNMRPQYAGSPWHNGQMTGPIGGNRVDYVMQFPDGDRFLGAGDFVLNNVGNPGGTSVSDLSGMAEQISYEIFKGINEHYNYRRYIHVFVNGDHRSTTANRTGTYIMEDSQQPNGDVIEEWFPDDTEGQLYKIEDWFEFADSATSFSNDDADLQRRMTTVDGVPQIKLAPYRFMWRKRSLDAGDSANDYTNLLAMIDIISPVTSPSVNPLPDSIVKQFGLVADFEQWMRIFAVQHTVGNWDAYGYNRGKNAYTYRPDRGRFMQMTWDIDFTMGIGGDGASTDLFGASDQRVQAMYATPEIVRAYWRAYQDIINGPLNNSYLDPLMDARARAFTMNNINYDPNGVNTIKSFVTARRSYIAGRLNSVASPFNIASTNIVASSNLVTITGTAPIDVKFIEVDGISYPITWTSTTAWSLRIPLTTAGSNTFIVTTKDRYTNTIPNMTRAVNIGYAGVVESAETNIVFSEIMYNALVPGAEFVEIYNRSATTTFDLTGWRIDGLAYTFPDGALIGPRSFLVLTADRVAYANAYGGGTPAFDQFNGSLQSNGERLTLVRPGSAGQPDTIVSRVRYDGELPWPTNTEGTGSSIQLIDPAQGSTRPGNWTARYVPATYTDPISTPSYTNDGWQFVSVTGRFGNDKRFLIYLDYNGSVVIDDVSIVSGTTPAQGPNYIVNGDFESPLGAEWVFGTNLVNSSIVSSPVRSGSGALRIVQTFPGGILARDIVQTLVNAPTNQETTTLSFWYYATNTTATNLTVRAVGSTLTTNVPVAISVIPSNYIPPMLITAATNYASPASDNDFSESLPAFQPLWINEVQAENITGPADNFGQREPWIEIHNSSTATVSLNGLYLSSRYTNLTEWAFPAGATIAPGEYKIVWADGQAGQTASGTLHTSFRLPAAGGSIALTRLHNGQPQVLDYLNYSGVSPDKSSGSFPDGQLFDRQHFHYVTPGAANDGRFAPLTVFINEWLAQNTNSILDPADNDNDDWFEIYNPTTNVVNLAGYFLTDDLTDKTQHLITTAGAHTIPPGGHLLVWADNEINQNSSTRGDMHVNFQLSRNGGAIGLFSADGTQVDAIVYGPQTGDVSEGRYPDGSSSIYLMTNTTPRAANYVPGAGNAPPTLNPIPERSVYVGETAAFTASGSDPDVGQALTYSLQGAPPAASINPSSGAFTWVSDTVGTIFFTVRVTDNGSPALSASQPVTIHVLAQPAFGTVTRNGNDLTLSWPAAPGRTYRIQYKNDLNEAQWTNLGQPLAASTGSLSLTDNVQGVQQRFYRLLIVP